MSNHILPILFFVSYKFFFFFFQAEDGIRDLIVTGVQTCALPIFLLLRKSQQPRILEFTNPGLLGLSKQEDLAQNTQAVLAKVLKPFMLRRTKEKEIGRASCRERV